MNEEEIIKRLTKPKKYNLIEILRKFKRDGIENYIITKPELVQGLLDLYNKEKERNKNLEQIEKEHKEENGRLRDRIKELEIEKENEFKRGFFTKVVENKANTLKIESQVIPIFKIEKKIEKLNKEEKKVLKGTKGQDRYSIKLEYMHKRNALQELLEESDK